MNKQEQARQATALYEFLEKMDKLETEACAEIEVLVNAAKRKINGK
jgi:hypothetical protein